MAPKLDKSICFRGSVQLGGPKYVPVCKTKTKKKLGLITNVTPTLDQPVHRPNNIQQQQQKIAVVHSLIQASHMLWLHMYM